MSSSSSSSVGQQIADEDFRALQHVVSLLQLNPASNSDSLAADIDTKLLQIHEEIARSLVGSEDQINTLSDHLQKILLGLDHVDTWLSLYSRQVFNMQKYFNQIEAENAALDIVTRNTESLIKEIDTISVLCSKREAHCLKKSNTYLPCCCESRRKYCRMARG